VALTIKLVEACREFRRWALHHKAEFPLLFGVPLPGIDDKLHDIADECAVAFASTFFVLFFELWQAAPFRVPAPQEIDPGLGAQLTRYRDTLGAGAELPTGAVLTFLRCWTLLYGAVSMEVFRPHKLRPDRSSADVRDHPGRPRHPDRTAVSAARLRPASGRVRPG
jgi:hypothetical protein